MPADFEFFAREKRFLWDEPECECRYIDDDQVDASRCLQHGVKCAFCSRLGGVPFLMMPDGLRCSRCFEDFTVEQFGQWMMEYPCSVEILNQECEREEITAKAKMFSASPGRKDPALCVQRPANQREEAA